MLSTKLKKEDMNKDMLGLSCIENYVLAQLRLQGNIHFFYYQSFLPIEEIYYNIFVENAEYANFKKNPRILKTAKDLGCLQYHWEHNVDMDRLDQFEQEYVLVQVRPDFLRDKYARRLFRDDHYVFLSQKDDNTFVYLNDNPADQAEISTLELNYYYVNDAFVFRTLNKPINYIDCLLSFYHIMNTYKKRTINIQYEMNAIKVRDFIGILKLSRKRIIEFVRPILEESDETHFSIFLQELNRLYSRLEYMRIRNRCESETIYKGLKYIFERDRICMRWIMLKVKTYLNKLTIQTDFT